MSRAAHPQKSLRFPAARRPEAIFLTIASRRLWRERTGDWQNAYDKRGTGSSFVRARIIDDDIYELAAPVPDVTPSPDQNQFLRDVIAEVDAAATEVGAQLQ